jgi:signal peptidase II
VKYRSALLIILLIIVIDQISKVYVKTHFYNGEEVNVIGHWFRLHFLENPGMAFGMQFSKTDLGKLILTGFRLIAVSIGFVVLRKLTLKEYSRGAIICGALILAGALGNLIDSLFYGLIFTESPYCYHDTTTCEVAHLVQWGKGYGTLFHGKVVDMFYFPLFNFKIGGRDFQFFEPVFNIADAAITTGVLTLMLFQKRLLKNTEKTAAVKAGEESAAVQQTQSEI